jgi:NAD(P)-dependent dehydrogenase (short-subunit alcohol dehydrogenase family)
LSGVFLLERVDSGVAAPLRARGLDVRRGDRFEAGADHLVTVAPPLELEPLAQLSPDAWLDRFGRWVEEPFLAVQEWLRDVVGRGVRGRWIAATTNLGTQPFPGAGAVGAFAAALHALVKVAAVEYGERGVRANAIAVGFREGEAPSWVDVERAVADTPAARLVRPEDVAAALAWLLSPEAEHVNGEVVRVDGGYTITRGAAAAPSDAAEEWLLEQEWRGIAR